MNEMDNSILQRLGNGRVLGPFPVGTIIEMLDIQGSSLLVTTQSGVFKFDLTQLEEYEG